VLSPLLLLPPCWKAAENMAETGGAAIARQMSVCVCVRVYVMRMSVCG